MTREEEETRLREDSVFELLSTATALLEQQVKELKRTADTLELIAEQGRHK